jgi:hypothetical protein
MFVAHPFRPRMTEKEDIRSTVHVPMVYETVVTPPVRWEYYVLKVDPREEALPDAPQLNALGQEGWILAGMLDERVTSKSPYVYYYFVKQQV